MPTRHTETRILIPAPLPEVWRALVELDAYPRWNPALRLRPWQREGLRAGARAWLSLRLGKLRLVVPVVVEAASGDELRWSGGPPGLFRGRHYFRLREVEGGTELTHGEDFSGLLLAPLWPLMARLLAPMYGDVNEALARHCVASRDRASV